MYGFEVFFCVSFAALGFGFIFSSLDAYSAERIPINLDTFVKLDGQTGTLRLTIRDGQTGSLNVGGKNLLNKQFKMTPTLVPCEAADCVSLEVEVSNAEGRVVSRPHILVELGQRATISQSSKGSEGESTLEMSVTPTLAK